MEVKTLTRSGMLLLALLPVAAYSNSVVNVKHQVLVSMHELQPFVIAQNGKATQGFIVEIFNLMAEHVGHSGKIELTTFVRAINRLQQKPYAQHFAGNILYRHRAHLILVRTEKRESLFKWVGPILYDGTVFYQRKEDQRVFHSLEELKTKNALCTIQRRVSETEIFERKGIPFYGTDTQLEAVSLMLRPKGRFDCTPIALMNTQTLLAKINIKSSALKAMAFQLPAQSIYMAFSLSTPDAVINYWQAALDRLEHQGQRIAIINKYVETYDKALESKFKTSLKRPL